MSPTLAKPLRLTESRSVGHNAVGVVPISERAHKGELGIDATKKLPGAGFKRPWPPLIKMDGRVKILDFGLAKLRSADAHIRAKETPGGELADVGIRAPDAEASTVVQSAAESTEPGRVMGTPSYMAPEQVRGESVDHRADLFAFGCVLYEMASGKRRRKLRSPQPVLRHLLSLPRRAPRPPPTRNPSPCCRLST